MLSYIFTGIVFLLIFSLLIFIHELGHFWMAKRAGMKVEEFGMGLPPRIWGKKKGETIYSINWIPFGGFVRIYGEDSTDPKVMKSTRSFAARPLRDRIKVVIAGVVMNFLLAWLLLTVGFAVGMKPLLMPDEVYPAISSGLIEVSPDLEVREVVEDSFSAANNVEVGDRLVAFNGENLNAEVAAALSKDKPLKGSYSFQRNGTVMAVDYDGKKDFGASFGNFLTVPRMVIHALPEEDLLRDVGLLEGDHILTVNGREVFDQEGLLAGLEESLRVGSLTFKVYRGGVVEDFGRAFPKQSHVMFSEISPDSPGAKVGLRPGDIVDFIESKEVASFEDFQKVVRAADGAISILIDRDGEKLNFVVEPVDGRVGVVLSDLRPVGLTTDATFYTAYDLANVDKKNLVNYAWYEAPFVALKESYKIAKISIAAFGGAITSIFAGDGVPEEVGGPVKIAYLTHLSIQGGVMDLLVLVALLSLGLAVLNILPIPALDGGRLLFLLIEWVRGKPLKSRFEMFAHAFGFLFLIAFIVVVTYSDIGSLL